MYFLGLGLHWSFSGLESDWPHTLLQMRESGAHTHDVILHELSSYRRGQVVSLLTTQVLDALRRKYREEIPPLHEYSTANNPRMRDFSGISRSSLVIGQPRGFQSFKHGGKQKSRLWKLMWNPAKYLQIYLTYVLWKWFKLLRKIYRIDRDGKIRTTVRGAVIWGK